MIPWLELSKRLLDAFGLHEDADRNTVESKVGLPELPTESVLRKSSIRFATSNLPMRWSGVFSGLATRVTG